MLRAGVLVEPFLIGCVQWRVRVRRVVSPISQRDVALGPTTFSDLAAKAASPIFAEGIEHLLRMTPIEVEHLLREGVVSRGPARLGLLYEVRKTRQTVQAGCRAGEPVVRIVNPRLKLRNAHVHAPVLGVEEHATADFTVVAHHRLQRTAPRRQMASGALERGSAAIRPTAPTDRRRAPRRN